MTTFTKTQLTAIMQATNVTSTVEEYAATMGFTVQEEAVKAVRATKREKGKTAVVVVYSAINSTALITTNSGFAGRSADWVIADWKKTVLGSRKSDVRFAQLVNAEDVAVQSSALLDAITATDKENVETASAQYIAHFVKAGYTFISKIKVQTQMQVQAILDAEEAEDATEEAQAENVVESVASYYNAVQGATGLLDNAYSYKNGKFVKAKSKKAKK